MREEFRSGFIAESPRKLRRMHRYFSAVCGLGAYPPVRCNVPEFSAVIGADGPRESLLLHPGTRRRAGRRGARRDAQRGPDGGAA